MRRQHNNEICNTACKPCLLYTSIIEALDAALEKRELIKVAVLKNCIDDPREIASVIGERTHSAVVKVIGKKMIFYRPAKKNPKIKLPE